MNASEFVESLSALHARLEEMSAASEKLACFADWMRRIHGLDHLLVLDFQSQALVSTGSRAAAVPPKKELFDYAGSLPASAAPIAANGTAGAAVLAPLLDGAAEFVHVPLGGGRGQALGALLLFTAQPREYFAARRSEINLAAAGLRDILRIEKLAAGNGSPSRNELAPAGSAPFAEFIERMNFPMFVLNRDGRLLGVNQSLLAKLKFASREEFVRRCDLFRDIFQRGETLTILNREGGIRGRKLSLNDAAGERITLVLSAAAFGDSIVGSFFDVSEYVRVADDLRESLKMQEFLNDKLISANLLRQKTESAAIRSLARLAEFRDHETGDHLQRICEYSRLIAREIFKRQPYDYKLRAEYCDDIVISSMLHDIGKVGVPDHILLKQGALDDEEWKVMKSHTVIGWTILNQADCDLGEQSFLTLASQIALNHHERWDGSGYPNGLRRDKIPLSARISAVADVYDALTSPRPYKKPWTHEAAMKEIRAASEVAFDPVIVDILVSVDKKMVDIRRQFPK